MVQEEEKRESGKTEETGVNRDKEKDTAEQERAEKRMTERDDK